MTIVAALKLNPELCMACSDERVSYSGRTYDVAKKLSKLTDYAFVGYSGSVAFSKKVMDKARGNINPDMSVGKMAYAIRDATTEAKEEVINNDAFRYFGVDSEEYKKKEPNINRDLLRNVEMKIADLSKSIFTNFVIAGYENPSVEIYSAPDGQGPYPSIDYYPTGSGSDLADATIAKWLQGMKPDERENISMSRGCRILMEATRSSWHNAGVGGRTQLVWTGKDRPFQELGYEESNMLQNLLYLEEVKHIDNDFVNGVLKDVVENGATYKDVKKKLMRKLPKEDLVDLFFREGLHT